VTKEGSGWRSGKKRRTKNTAQSVCQDLYTYLSYLTLTTTLEENTEDEKTATVLRLFQGGQGVRSI
jgi:hypothetical protein